MDRFCSTGTTDTEYILWQGRPAPRCYTFRHWRMALRWGGVLCVVAILRVWMWQSWRGDPPLIMVLLLMSLFLVALFLSFGRLLYARFEWEYVFYSFTDTCVLIRRRPWGGVVQYSYAQLHDVHLELYNDNVPLGLGWVHMQCNSQRVSLECLEDAQKAYLILCERIANARA